MNEENVSQEQKKKIGFFSYFMAGLSFIPLIGVIFGIIVIVIGILKRKAGGVKLIIAGTLGILVTVALYATLFYKGFVEEGGMFDELSSNLAKSQLTDLVKHIEYYKIQNGKYPHQLKDLVPKEGDKTKTFVFINDPMNKSLDLSEPVIFYYELVNEGKNYYLFSSGNDGVPFNTDDIHPVVSQEESGNIGYLRK